MTATLGAMSKLMYALWGDRLATSLHSPELHGRLAALGVRRLQVNVDDEDVADAMRIPHCDPPIGAFVTLWTETDPADLGPALLDAADRVAGWLVEERRPLDPPEHWDGRRAEALANIAALRLPADIPHDEWVRRWHEDHTRVAVETQATFGYLQNLVVAPVTDGAPALVAIVEELFPPEAAHDMHAFYGSGGDQAELQRRMETLMESVQRIGADRDLDLVPTSRYLYDLAD